MSYWVKHRKIQARIKNTVENILNKQDDDTDLDIGPTFTDTTLGDSFSSTEQCLQENDYSDGNDQIDIVEAGNIDRNSDRESDISSGVSDEEEIESLASPITSSSDGLSDDDNAEFNLQNALSKWAIKNHISHTALRELLNILKPIHTNLPRDPRTLLSTGKVPVDNIVAIGSYHFGIKSGLLKALNCSQILRAKETISLQFNVDGLPLFRSTNHQFWPILGMVSEENMKPFVIGLYSGMSKPTNLDAYLFKFIEDVEDLLVNGVSYREKIYNVAIRSFVCDTPARCFLKKSKLYSGYSGCDKCTQEGIYEGRMTFPLSNAPVRSDESFSKRLDEDHHVGISPLTRLPIGMVTQFPLDYMHLVCLGVVRKTLSLWKGGSLKYRLSAQTVLSISDHLVSLRENVPAEFARKPRGLTELDRWKATELRMFLLYLGHVVLKGKIANELYDNFMLLAVGIHILVNPDAVMKNPLISEDAVIVEREIARYLRGKSDRGGKRKQRQQKKQEQQLDENLQEAGDAENRF